jgi:hypothetical protein
VLPQLEDIQKKSSADTLAGNKGKQLIHKVRSSHENGGLDQPELQPTSFFAYRPCSTNWCRSWTPEMPPLPPST